MTDSITLRMPDLTSQVLLDGGSESWITLGTVVERCLGEMLPGQVLHLISAHPEARFEVPSWCRQAGHEIVAARSDTVESLFWIRKQG